MVTGDEGARYSRWLSSRLRHGAVELWARILPRSSESL